MGNSASIARRSKRSSSSLANPFSQVPPVEKSPAQRPIEKILIANRGEIACRIIKTARSLGLKTVAVYSDADRNSLHVRRADEAVFIGPASAQLSYLSTTSILDAARRTGADAIHPGYGFLSENSKFAQACHESGITFIGPSAAAISLMGDKSASKKLMSGANVPVVPGYHGDDQSHELLQSEADRIGYPVLIKPVLGGGGKGMRIVHSRDEFLDSLRSALRESAAAFGDTRVLIEKYIAQPRHIEVQIFGDRFGNVVHLFERDCSVQRRHQKIIEEAPAPLMSDDFRNSIGQAAVNAAKVSSFVICCCCELPVEFIVDTATGDFFFMEMNTRLQVEHPVTEMVTRQDLVEWQIRVANGESLPLEQKTGHAFEARVYAENVPRGFLPAAGVLYHYNPPPASSTVRIETGVEQSDAVSVHYDPMIAKLVVWGSDRDMALAKLHNCLSNFQASWFALIFYNYCSVAGLPTNIHFLKKLAKHPAFRAGDVETHFIEHHKNELLDFSERAKRDVKSFAALAAVGVCVRETFMISSAESRTGGPWHTTSGFRVNNPYTRKISLDWMPESESLSCKPMSLDVTYSSDNEFLVKFAEDSSCVKLTAKRVASSGCDITVDINGISSTINYGYYLQKSAYHIHVWKDGEHHHFTTALREAYDTESHGETSQRLTSSGGSSKLTPGAVASPMAGLAVKVLAELGSNVKAGDPLLVLEAMKMEHTVKAHISGVINQVNITAGQQVSDGGILFHIKAQES
ncbi:hypothetical protein SELMODRAFT_77392 [Selaginella moellendorffii]|uniref:Methylcrotonoyl-CoA carboxylase subunit alpha, mitochondrial n=1 Tax=Selaginella moellendorffii TaxID=88036 RepID=D8QRV7_SELML|nr:hypothetical protein SELMODRAFT_77392 [Selaginella moellendorffii]